MGSVEQMQSPMIPPTTIQLSEILSREISEISGVNEELLGSADDDKAGILSMLRQGAGLVTLEKLFDNLDLSQKIMGERSMQIIQANFSYGKVKRILGKAPSEQFMHKAFQKYDSCVSEGLLTETQRKTEFIQYMNLQQAGLPIPPEILIDKAPIQGKKELKDAIMAQQQAQQQMEQRQAELQMQTLETENQTKISFSEAQHALAAERFAKVQEERMAALKNLEESDTEKTNSMLNLVKAIKELESLDLENIGKKIEILKQMSIKEEGRENEAIESGSASQQGQQNLGQAGQPG
jgi:hypothetical protein